MDSKTAFIAQLIDAHGPLFSMTSDAIWDTPELRFAETVSSKLQQKTMSDLGFTITSQLGDIDTAFLASWSSADSEDSISPIVGFLGELDALPGLSQVADLTTRKPLAPGAAGHGCGHNLLGVACMQAAVALKEYMEARHITGTVRYYGCPGEESGAGKAFLVRAGCFDDVDACFSWHPGPLNAYTYDTLANVRVLYSFQGIPAHAGAAPQLGRSALDAAELMNTGIQYLREHVDPDIRIHYAFTDAGSDAPNIVQAHAQLLYAVRAPSLDAVRLVFERVNKVAHGAAMMTETTVDIQVVSSYANLIANPTLVELAHRHMDEALPLEVSTEELAYASAFRGTLSETERAASEAFSVACGGTGRSVADFIVGTSPVLNTSSTDVGDVSWKVPTACISVATAALGTPLHSWQMTAQGKSAIAHEGGRAAATILALAACDLLEDPSLIDQARDDLQAALRGREYETMIPPEVEAGAF